MKHVAIVFFTLLTTFTLTSAVMSGSSGSGDDEGQIRGLTMILIDKFNERDAAGFVEHFAWDVHFISPFGPYMQGKERIKNLYAFLFEQGIISKEEKWVMVDHSISFLQDDMAIIYIRGKNGRGQDAEEDNGFLIFEKKGEDWVVRSMQLTPIQMKQ